MTHRIETRPSARRDWRGCLWAWVLLLCATGLVVADAGLPLRVFALPALVIVPGLAVVRLLYRSKPVRPARSEPTVADTARDPALRALLTVLSGVLTGLLAALALNALGIPITATTLACAVGALGAVLFTAATLWTPASDAPGAAAPGTGRLRAAGTAAAAAVAVTASVAAAVAIVPTPAEHYTTVGFLDSNVFAAEPFTAEPNAPVRLNWVLRGYGCDISAELTTVQIEIDGTPVDDIALDVGAVTNASEVSTLTGAATFSAPDTTGRHAVRLTVTTGTADSSVLPQPGFLTTTLEVEQ